jgi:sigma-E factor negative regulatory protein RseA
MTEKAKESLSALMDNESDELEFQRILSASEDEGLRGTWRRYHITRSVMREGNINTEFASIDISRQVSAALLEESSHKPALL